MYWYNPKTRTTEATTTPQTEAEAMSLLAGDPNSEAFRSEYERLRRAGMGIRA